MIVTLNLLKCNKEISKVVNYKLRGGAANPSVGPARAAGKHHGVL
jgi:hypothetical protein